MDSSLTAARRAHKWVAALFYPGMALVAFTSKRALHGRSVSEPWPTVGLLCVLLGLVAQTLWFAPIANGPYADAWRSYRWKSLVAGIPASAGVLMTPGG